ncbi:hypothetical protein [Erythrobacter sp. QSSC1-22B]|uniref:hypothetical protein n=1 Tax=Erythrobacter sp. QSSC1-22B TaxID=1860125 RepID=UPI0011A7656F|nr:hypothetical protein [Erythrobacter sp. QSSC1-22B]
MADLVDRASDAAVTHDLQVLQDFAQKLRGLGDSQSDVEAVALLPGLRIPAGFCHARYTFFEVVGTQPHGEIVLGQPKYAGELISGSLAPLDLISLVRTALVFSADTGATSMGPGRWIESFALPIKDPGMLELALVLEPRESNDGSETARIEAAIRMVKARPWRKAPGQ